MHTEGSLDFLTQVKLRAHLSDAAAASRCVIATLETLAEHLSREYAARVALHLPAELRTYFLRADDRPTDFSIKRFFLRVSVRENGTYLSAVFHARCVLEVLAESIPASDLSDIQNLLPKEFGVLFRRDSVQQERMYRPNLSILGKEKLLHMQFWRGAEP